MAFRLVNLVFAAVFVASGVLQYNDKAGLAWAALYFIGTSVSLHGAGIQSMAAHRTNMISSIS